MDNRLRRSRRWCFTINNPDQEDQRDDPQTWLQFRYLVWQKEEGLELTDHLQGYVVWTNSRSLGAMKLVNPRAHWEKARGTTEQNIKYCTKQESHIAGPWERGVRPQPGKRNDLFDVQDMLDEGASLREVAQAHFPAFAKYYRAFEKYRLLTTNPRYARPQVFVIVGLTGTGKSRFCHEFFPGAFWKPRNKWWDGYTPGQQPVVWDDFYGWYPLDGLLRVLDWYDCVVETKGGSCRMLSNVHVFTSNVHPRNWYKKAPLTVVRALERRVTEFGAVVTFGGAGQMLLDRSPWYGALLDGIEDNRNTQDTEEMEV